MQLKHSATVKLLRVVTLSGVSISSLAGFCYWRQPDREPRVLAVLIACILVSLFSAFLSFLPTGHAVRPSERGLIISGLVLFGLGILLILLFVIVHFVGRF